MSKDTSGAAFPSPSRIIPTEGGMEQVHTGFGGLTKREIFAMTALQGLLSRPFSEYPSLPADISYVEHFTCSAVTYADALINALKE